MPSLSFQARPEVGFALSRTICCKKKKKKNHGESVKLIRDSFVGIRSRADIQSQHAGAGNIMPRPGGGGFLLEQGPPPAQGGMHYK